jgi:hypothetical protein
LGGGGIHTVGPRKALEKVRAREAILDNLLGAFNYPFI